MDSQAIERELRIRTEYEVIDGVIRISPLLRTLDDLNRGARNFLTVYKPVVPSNVWQLEHGALAVNKSSILFVIELTEAPPVPAPPGSGPAPDRYARSALRLRVGDYLVEGYVHVPPGGTPLARLYQDSHPFVALTSTTVARSTAEFKAPFLAVNRLHILAAQELRRDLPAAAGQTGR